MMHKAWSSIKQVPYCFSRWYIKLQGHTAKKSYNLTQFGRFRTVTPVWIHWRVWNDTQSLMLYRRPCLIIFRGHPSNLKVTRAKNRLFESNLSKITRPVAAVKSLRFALFLQNLSLELGVLRGLNEILLHTFNSTSADQQHICVY